MKTKIVSTRIPVGQASGPFDIYLPTGFGVPKGFVAYAMDNITTYNNFDSLTDFPCISVGFGGSNIAGTGLTNICVYVSNNETNVTSTISSFGNTVSVFTTNIAGTVRRQWQMTSFAQDVIFGQYQATGTQTSPLDICFTVFGGDDFKCAVGQTALPAAINTLVNVNVPFQPDALLYSGMRPAQTTDGNINFGAATRDAAAGTTNVNAQMSVSWRNLNTQTTAQCTSRVDITGTFNLATNAQIRAQYMSPLGIGFTQSTVNTGNSVMFMALEAGYGVSTYPAFALGTFQSATGTGNSFYNVGFKPAHILGSFTFCPNTNTTYTTQANGTDSFSVFTANGFQKSNFAGIGTFTSSTSSPTITGVGTSFLNQFGSNDLFYTNDYRLVGTVTSITSNTSLILQANAAITATGATYVFEKPQQFSFSYGNEDAGTGATNMRGYVSDNAIVSFTATTPSLQNVGNITNFDGQNGFNVNYTTITGGLGGRYGWYLAIRDEDFYFRRRGSMF